MITALCWREAELTDSAAAWARKTWGRASPPIARPPILSKTAPGVTIAIRRGFFSKNRKHREFSRARQGRSGLRSGGLLTGRAANCAGGADTSINDGPNPFDRGSNS